MNKNIIYQLLLTFIFTSHVPVKTIEVCPLEILGWTSAIVGICKMIGSQIVIYNAVKPKITNPHADDGQKRTVSPVSHSPFTCLKKFFFERHCIPTSLCLGFAGAGLLASGVAEIIIARGECY